MQPSERWRRSGCWLGLSVAGGRGSTTLLRPTRRRTGRPRPPLRGRGGSDRVLRLHQPAGRWDGRSNLNSPRRPGLNDSPPSRKARDVGHPTLPSFSLNPEVGRRHPSAAFWSRGWQIQKDSQQLPQARLRVGGRRAVKSRAADLLLPVSWRRESARPAGSDCGTSLSLNP